MTRKQKQRMSVNPYRGAYVWPEDTVSFSLPAGSTHADEVREIARQLHLEVAPLPEELSRTKSSFGKTIFESGYRRLLKIAANYEGWEFQTNGKELRTVKHSSHLSAFDEQAGRLMVEAKRTPKGHLAIGEYERITAEIDRHGFKLTNELEGQYKTRLGGWNHRNPNKPIRTFSEALGTRGKLHYRTHKKDSTGNIIESKDYEFSPRTGVLRRLSRALTTYLAAHPELRKSA